MDEAERSLLSSSAGRKVVMAMVNGDPVVIFIAGNDAVLSR